MSSLNFRQPPSPQETGVPFEMQEYHSRKATYGVGEEDFICMSRIEEAEREMGERRKNEEDAQVKISINLVDKGKDVLSCIWWVRRMFGWCLCFC